MNPAAAWNLRGIGYETRLAAEHAARQAGMTIGEWLEEIVAQRAANDDDKVEPVVRGPQRLDRPARQSEPVSVTLVDRTPAASARNPTKLDFGQF